MSTPQPAIWLRMIAVLCIVMVTFMSAAQSCHTHAEASSLRQSSQQHHQPAPEDHCPVCMAMHSAIPVTAQGSQATIIDVAQYLVPLPAVEAHGTIRSFDLQTRPPPSA